MASCLPTFAENDWRWIQLLTVWPGNDHTSQCLSHTSVCWGKSLTNVPVSINSQSRENNWHHMTHQRRGESSRAEDAYQSALLGIFNCCGFKYTLRNVIDPNMDCLITTHYIIKKHIRMHLIFTTQEKQKKIHIHIGTPTDILKNVIP